MAKSIISNELNSEKKQPDKIFPNLHRPSEIKGYLDQYVIGQDKLAQELKDLRKYKEVTKPLLENQGVKKEIAASNNLENIVIDYMLANNLDYPEDAPVEETAEAKSEDAPSKEANEILDVENVIASIMLLENLRIQKN